MFGAHQELSYVISDKASTLYVFFKGVLNQSEATEHKLEECQNLVAQSGASEVIIDFKEVTGMDPSVLGRLAGLHQMAHQKRARLRMCFLPLEIRDFLLRQGLVSSLELSESLTGAIRSLSARRP